MKAVFVASILALIALGWAFRWEITPLPGNSKAYLLNRWTGEIYFLDQDEMLPVKLTKAP